MDFNERLFTGFLTRIAAALEGCQNALEEIANTERLEHELNIDSRAKVNQINDETIGLLSKMGPMLSHLGFDGFSDEP